MPCPVPALSGVLPVPPYQVVPHYTRRSFRMYLPYIVVRFHEGVKRKFGYHGFFGRSRRLTAQRLQASTTKARSMEQGKRCAITAAISTGRRAFRRRDWIDLSTGINRRPWRAAPLSAHAMTALPTRADMARLCRRQRTISAVPAIRSRCRWPGPRPRSRSCRSVLNGKAGRRCRPPITNTPPACAPPAGRSPSRMIQVLAGADLAVIVNPNNPDGREYAPAQIAPSAATVGHLIVDEFCRSASRPVRYPARPANVTVLRIRQVLGLAGLRLLCHRRPDLLARMAEHAGPGQSAAGALEISIGGAGRPQMGREYRHLAPSRPRCIWTRSSPQQGWRPRAARICSAFIIPPDAQAAQDQPARAGIWGRRFPRHPHWLRLGIPGNRAEFARVEAALTAAGLTWPHLAAGRARPCRKDGPAPAADAAIPAAAPCRRRSGFHLDIGIALAIAQRQAGHGADMLFELVDGAAGLRPVPGIMDAGRSRSRPPAPAGSRKLDPITPT